MDGAVKTVEILDVSARDGLQNEARHFSTDQKIELIERAVSAGIKRIEVTSFAHPKHVPQMADAEAVIDGLGQRPELTFIGLVMNQRGLDRALATTIDEIGCIAVASDTFAQKNQGQTRAESVAIACQLIAQAKAERRSANVTIGAAFGCPFEGEVEFATVRDMALQLAEAGPREISLADTIGVGDPWRVQALFTALRKDLPGMKFRAHFHNTRNTGIANAFAAIQAGVTTLDASIGGIGGCPFAPAATGNIPSEDLAYMLQRHALATEVSLDQLIQTAAWLTQIFDRDLPGMLARAGLFPSPQHSSKSKKLVAEMT